MTTYKLKNSLQHATALIPLVVAFAMTTPRTAQACQQVPGSLPAQHFYLDLATGMDNRITSGAETITVTGCQGVRGSELQLALGSYARLPWDSAYYGFVTDNGQGGMIGIQQLPDVALTAAAAITTNQCRLTNAVSTLIPDYNPKQKITDEKKALNACIEYRVRNLSQGKVILAQSSTCTTEIINPNEVVARGEGCAILQPYGSYEIRPQLSKNCAGSEELKKIRYQDLDGRFLARYTVEDKAKGNSLDLITSQAMRLKFTDSSNVAITKTEFKGLKNAMQVSEDYAANYHFSKLTLNGVPEIKVKAKLSNMIINVSDVNCTTVGCSGPSQQRAPVTIENSIVLKKQNGTVIVLKTWQQNLIAQAQWYGIEGDTSGDYSLTGGNTEVELSPEIKKVAVGDSIVVISQLLHPNEGINSLAAALTRSSVRDRQSRVTTVVSSGTNKIATLPTLDTLTMQTLPELALGSTPMKAGKKRPSWAYEFEKYCDASGKHCVSLNDDRTGIPLNQTLTELKVTSLDTGIVTEVIRTVKISQVPELRYDYKVNSGIQFNCKSN